MYIKHSDKLWFLFALQCIENDVFKCVSSLIQAIEDSHIGSDRLDSRWT